MTLGSLAEKPQAEVGALMALLVATMYLLGKNLLQGFLQEGIADNRF